MRLIIDISRQNDSDMKIIGIIGGILCGLIAFCILIVMAGCLAALFGAYDRNENDYESKS